MNALRPANAASASLAQGYESQEYAEALGEFGVPLELPRSGGTVLLRAIPGSTAQDAMGCYPLFACRDWSQVSADLENLTDRLVSVACVTDPFADTTPAQLQATFPDVCLAYKEHLVSDLSLPLSKMIDSHHRRNIRKATARMEVFPAAPSSDLLQQWQTLYDNLIARHGIVGIARFSPQSFARQFTVPGFTAFAATDGENILGMTLWYESDGVAYYHLGAYSDLGYELGASFAIFSVALSHFQSSGVRWAALGAGAGAKAVNSGLTRFKKGWSTGTRTAYFCGRVLQPAVYQALAASSANSSDFFPAYRRPVA
jgi:hypothetical protein